MIIGIDASRANRDHKTGVEWYAYYIIKNLVEMDHDNDYILYSDKPLKDDLARLCREHSNCKEMVLHWPFRRFWTLGRLSWEMVMRPPDVLFVPAHTLPLFSRAKMVNTIHDVAFMIYPQFYSHYERLHLRWSTRFALSRAEQIITVSNFTKQEIFRYFLMAQEDKISVVHHGYDKALYHPVVDRTADSRILDYYRLEKPYFIYIGRLESKKNIVGLLNAFRNFCQARPNDKTMLVLAGQRSHDYAPINNLLADPIIKGRAKELGWVPEQDLPVLLRQSMAFIYPSWYEGFGLPVIQSMACGVPVLASRVGSLPEIGAHAALYFDPADQDELLDKMKQLADDAVLRRQLSQAGLRRAVKFSWSQAAAQTLEILKQSHDSP